MSERRAKRRVEFIESYWTGGFYGSDYVWNDNHGELVRCKDCKHQHEYRTGSCPYYTTYGSVPQDEWYFADGERAMTWK